MPNDRYSKLSCPETLYGHHSDPDADGKCTWCGRKIAARAQRPLPPVDYVNELDEAYGTFYDPDWDGKPKDA
jgi:hypothetical protein